MPRSGEPQAWNTHEVSFCLLLHRRLFPNLPKGHIPERYPPRIFLCALMVLRHPEVRGSGVQARLRARSHSPEATGCTAKLQPNQAACAAAKHAHAHVQENGA